MNIEELTKQWEQATGYSRKDLSPAYKSFLDFSVNGKASKQTEPQLTIASKLAVKARETLVTGDKLVGLSTGYVSLDNMTKGLAPGDLIIIYGDTSHGKSQLTQNITYRLARKKIPVLFIGLEMTNVQNTSRFLQIGKLDTLLDATLPFIFYPETNDLRYENIEGYLRFAAEHGIKLVVIDQLQQLTRTVDNVTNETSQITHELKRMAVKYNIPVILISHINRSGSTGSAPTLRELKGSSSIEQDADICLAVWRDMDPMHSNLDKMEVWLRKNRNRGMQQLSTILYVKHNVLLVEDEALKAIQRAFPGAVLTE